MNCDEARPLLDASVDRELSAADEWRVREHLSGCAPCRDAADVVQAISRTARAAPYHRAPPDLAARIVAALPPLDAPNPEPAPRMVADDDARVAKPTRAEDGKKAGFAGWRWPSFGGFGGFGAFGGSGAAGGAPATGARAPAFAWSALGVLALGALGLVAALHLREPAATGAFVDELVASHVRAQISGRDLDVISTDRHTVKPWFNGRIDYAPPVEDLDAQGFPLVGGRLDYVGRERVAVLVYRFRKHVIDVYVFPPGTSGPQADAAAPPRDDGYALAHWQAGGMTWWAVTDAGPDALVGLRAALDARLAGGGSGG
ncbi:Anti-sigma factor RsiW [Paraburkholderia tropica]|uniref:zf-HC2 domain-containing protein n=1 Tax=Paraburkholderia tropica TaxID=92647 RepID=UPI001CAC284D|nr:zf-HC2 domain-containing protein [Paraburkholderia tropica]CAG9196207.1 Anti-sigma factor RsiW [Paraburkholderia tropica]